MSLLPKGAWCLLISAISSLNSRCVVLSKNFCGQALLYVLRGVSYIPIPHQKVWLSPAVECVALPHNRACGSRPSAVKSVKQMPKWRIPCNLQMAHCLNTFHSARSPTRGPPGAPIDISLRRPAHSAYNVTMPDPSCQLPPPTSLPHGSVLLFPYAASICQVHSTGACFL